MNSVATVGCQLTTKKVERRDDDEKWSPIMRQRWEDSMNNSTLHRSMLSSITTQLSCGVDLTQFFDAITLFHGHIMDLKALKHLFADVSKWEHGAADEVRYMTVYLEGRELIRYPWLQFPLSPKGVWRGEVLAQQSFRKGMCLGPICPVKVFKHSISDRFGPRVHHKMSTKMQRYKDAVFTSVRDRKGSAHPVILYMKSKLIQLNRRTFPDCGLGLQLISSCPVRQNVAICDDGMVYATKDIHCREALYMPPKTNRFS